jgi:methyl-accepting chemotaxis protein
MNAEDHHGNFYIKELISAGIDGGGYSEYWFPKLGEEEAVPKRSYSLLFEPFGWVIGTGYYR